MSKERDKRQRKPRAPTSGEFFRQLCCLFAVASFPYPFRPPKCLEFSTSQGDHPAYLAVDNVTPQMGEFQSEAEAMKAHRRQAVEKKFAKVKQSLNKEREHRLADLKVK